MVTIQDLRKKYHKLIAPLDMELLFSFVLEKPREFVLAHPEYKITVHQSSVIENNIKRRIKGEPIAYLTGKKEFYGLEFKVNKNTLIPRPETELMVELALEEVRTHLRKRLRTDVYTRVCNTNIIDVGTGSGNIIISIAKQLKNQESRVKNYAFYGTDISRKALIIAKQNAKQHKLDKKINFLHGDLLSPIIGNLKFDIGNSRTIVLANLPYLSSQIYASTPRDVKLYEPKTALYSPQNGLEHYITLLKQVQILLVTSYRLPVTLFMEISPEQKGVLSLRAGYLCRNWAI